MINIRIENQGDILRVRTLNERAFEQPGGGYTGRAVIRDVLNY